MTDDEVADLARELVGIPSHKSERRAGDYIERWLRRETDGEVRRDDAGNVFAFRGDSDPELCFVGHHDVVPPDETQVDSDGNYTVEVRDGRLYGRGSADMKGGLAAAMLAYRDVSSHVGFVSFVGEEMGGEGCRYALEHGFSPSKAVVLEGSTGYTAPGVVDVCVAHKGRRGIEVVCRGEPSHASEPREGVNAIYRAADLVNSVKETDFLATEIYGERMEGSVCVTGIEGGEAINTVPSKCVFRIDERTVPGERVSYRELRQKEDVEVEETMDLPPMICRDREYVKDVLETVDGDRIVKPHASDAGWLSRADVDCVVIGPAEPGEAHTRNESVSIDALRKCRQIYRDIAEEIPH